MNAHPPQTRLPKGVIALTSMREDPTAIRLFVDDISTYETHQDLRGSIVHLRSGETRRVFESPAEIDARINDENESESRYIIDPLLPSAPGHA